MVGRALGWQVSGNSCNRAPHALSLFTSNKICFDCFYTPLTLFITFHFSHFHFLQGVPGCPRVSTDRNQNKQQRQGSHSNNFKSEQVGKPQAKTLATGYLLLLPRFAPIWNYMKGAHAAHFDFYHELLLYTLYYFIRGHKICLLTTDMSFVHFLYYQTRYQTRWSRSQKNQPQ